MIELFRYIEHSFVPPATEDKSINVEDDSDLQNTIRRERDQPSGHEIIRRITEEFIQSNFSEGRSPFKLKKELLEFHAAVQQLKNPDDDKVKALIKEVFDIEPQDLVQSNNFRTDKKILNDSIVAAKLITAYDKLNTTELVAMRQSVAFIELSVLGKLGANIPVKSILLRPMHIPLSLFPIQKPVGNNNNRGEGSNENESARIEDLKKEADTLEAAYHTLMSVEADDLEVGTAENDVRGERIQAAESLHEREGEGGNLTEVSARTFVRLSEKLFQRASREVRTTLEKAAIDPTLTPLPKIITRIKEKWTVTTKELLPHLIPVAPRLYQLGMHTMSIPAESKIKSAEELTIVPDFSHAVTRPVGIGNLQVVRQELIGYEAGEISHIENVLEGELYRRSSSRTESSELTITEETETTQSEERDLQTTDRNEMVSEAQKESSKQTTATNGQSTTVDYGKLVENSKTNFARSVTDRAVNSLTQRTKELRVRREQKSFTEETTHEFDNSKGTNKVRGIYQWVDKKYKTRIMNYGKRLLYDVVIPEPATFLIESLKKSRQPESFQLVKPIAPWFGPQHINVANYMGLAQFFDVTGSIQPPPEEFVSTIADFKTDKVEKVRDVFFYSNKLRIPEGYAAISGYITRLTTQVFSENGLPDESKNKTGIQFEFMIGGQYLVRFGPPPNYQYAWNDFIMNNENGDLPVLFRSFSPIAQFGFAVGINCKRMDQAYEKWQLKAHAVMMQGYRRQLSEYEDKLAQHLAMVRTQMMLTKNYARNPKVEHTELKKAFIHLLMSEHFGQVSIITPDPLVLPMDPKYIKKWGAVAAFFERAFEWENIIYYYYPYFWGRSANWGDMILRQDLDPQFEEFLKAGAARVVVPVRPGFEGAMAHYHETGDVWMGEEMPDMFSELYVSIIEEIKARNYAPGEEKCVMEWEIKLPTTLVMLKEDEKLPEWQSKIKCNPVDE
jgi:hypothetical protein